MRKTRPGPLLRTQEKESAMAEGLFAVLILCCVFGAGFVMGSAWERDNKEGKGD